MRDMLLLFILILMTTFMGGCNTGNSEDAVCFVATFFDAPNCSGPYWMLEREDDIFFVSDSDIPYTPQYREWRQAHRPNDGVGTIVESPNLLVDTITIGFDDRLVICMTYGELDEVAQPFEWFSSTGECTEWQDDEPNDDPNCDDEEDDDQGHGNDCDHDDDDNPGRGHGHHHHGHDD